MDFHNPALESPYRSHGHSTQDPLPPCEAHLLGHGFRKPMCPSKAGLLARRLRDIKCAVDRSIFETIRPHQSGPLEPMQLCYTMFVCVWRPKRYALLNNWLQDLAFMNMFDKAKIGNVSSKVLFPPACLQHDGHGNGA